MKPLKHRTPTVLDEFAGVDVGDARLDARIQLMAVTLARDPKLSLPEAFGDGAELEAAYRLFSNESVQPADMMRAHVDATGARLRPHKRVLCVHDSTEFKFGGKAVRRGLTRKNGFKAHMSLAVSADGRREPLGLLAATTWTHSEQTKGRAATEQRRKDPDRMSKRWLAQSLEAEAVVGDVRLIHVEDREADIYESMSRRVQLGMGFIIRGKSGRKVLSADGLEEIRERLRNQAHPIQRDVMLSRRQTDGRQHHYQAREGRPARLEIGACRVDIRRSMRDPASLPVALTLNAVHVIEVNAPAGEQVVEWMLLTTEPIGTEEEICFVVDSYRARWVIEEYFKALKTGCGYEERQLESYDGLQRALAIYAVIAWRLLWARFLARSATSRPATDIGTPAELAVLVSQGRLTENASAEEFVMAVANLGGHIKRNGPPGWQVLWRGFRTLNAFAAGFAAASERSDQW